MNAPKSHQLGHTHLVRWSIPRPCRLVNPANLVRHETSMVVGGQFPNTTSYIEVVTSVPCVKWPFEWEIHGRAQLATFCYVLRAPWCHRVCFSCYLRQNGGTINVSKFEVSTSPLFPPHIRWCSVESGMNSPKFPHRLTQGGTGGNWGKEGGRGGEGLPLARRGMKQRILKYHMTPVAEAIGHSSNHCSMLP